MQSAGFMVHISIVSFLALFAGRIASADQPDLIFYQDFDHGPTAVCGGGWACDEAVYAESLVPGRFGNAYRMERARRNFLSPNQASVEEGLDGFVAGPAAKLGNVETSTPFGRKALRAEVSGVGVAWSLAPVAVKLSAIVRKKKVFVLSAYVRSDQPSEKVRLSLADENENSDWRSQAEKANKVQTDPKKVQPSLETVSVPAEVTIGTEWRRIAARLEIDARREEQRLVGRLEIPEGAPAVIYTDGLQLEQAAAYPTQNTDPTTWLPGGESRPEPWIDLPVFKTGFKGRQGTLGCWVKALPDQCGGIRDINAIVAIGLAWGKPAWQIGGASWYSGDVASSGYKRGVVPGAGATRILFEKGDLEGWRSVTLAWDESEMVGYVDGKAFAQKPLDAAAPAPGTILRLGGGLLEKAPMTGDLDEVYLFSRRLSDDEIAALARRQTPLSTELPNILVRRPVRTDFLRGEPQTEIRLEPVAYGTAATKARVKASVAALQAEVDEEVTPGGAAVLDLKPWLAEPGKYPLSIQASAGDAKVAFEDTVAIFEEPPAPEFIICSWSDDKDLAALGFNCAFGGSAGGDHDLLERGLWATSRIDVRAYAPYPCSPENLAAAKPIAFERARESMGLPNVTACLVNSETGEPPFPVDDKWFNGWMKEETGLDKIPPEIARPPVHIEDRNAPAIVPETYAPYRFCRWWNERGLGYWLLDQQLVRWMREAGLHTLYYTDQPHALAQFHEMDMMDNWAYPITPDGLVAQISHLQNMARLVNKPFQFTPGNVYWDAGSGLWLTDDDGKRKVLCLSPHCLQENLWLSVACPATRVGFYGMNHRHRDIYDKACDAAMTETYNVLRPVGVLVGGLPSEPAKVAFLETDGLYFIQPGAGNNWGRYWLTRRVSRCLARARLPYDWITDDHAYAGWLSRYEAVVLPGAWCLPERTHKALGDYAARGGRVIADKVLRAEIPGAARLGIETQAYPDDQVEAELGRWARGFRDSHPTWAQVAPVESVYTYTREAGPARYLFIINDHREPGPQYEKWKVAFDIAGRKEPLRDRGLPQDVTVKVPAGCTLYDVLAHKRIEAGPDGDGQSFSMRLAPGWAAVIAAFPRPIADLQFSAPNEMTPGSEASIAVNIWDDAKRPVPGRQLVEIRVTSPAGPWRGVQQYRRVVDGALTVLLRLPLTAKRGTWRIEVMEWVSGLKAARELEVR